MMSALETDSGLILLPGIALGGDARAGPIGGKPWRPGQHFQQDFISLAPEQQEDLLRLARELGRRLRVESAAG